MNSLWNRTQQGWCFPSSSETIEFPWQVPPSDAKAHHDLIKIARTFFGDFGECCWAYIRRLYRFVGRFCGICKGTSRRHIYLFPMDLPWVYHGFTMKHYGLTSGNQTWKLEIHSIHWGFNRKITYNYSVFSSTPCLITGGYFELSRMKQFNEWRQVEPSDSRAPRCRELRHREGRHPDFQGRWWPSTNPMIWECGQNMMAISIWFPMYTFILCIYIYI